MNIVFIAHPAFLNYRSMSRFANMLANGMKERGHKVEVWSPGARFSILTVPSSYKKWLGYIDQYIVFSREIKQRIKLCPPDTLFVITDNALGPWVPIISNRPHIIHCHDFLAQSSALGRILENPVSWTGKQYQAFIRRGYLHGSNFVSVSEKTKHDLHQFLPYVPAFSEVVYNGLNPPSVVYSIDDARLLLGKETGLDFTNGYLLHVGGNQWYKNRVGVVAIYDALRLNTNCKLPLILIGEKPDAALSNSRASSPYEMDIHCLCGLSDLSVQLAYTGASVFIFPSLAEGFGWPIAEAMAAGCPVVTTNEVPMTEVGGDAAFFISRRPAKEDVNQWAYESAMTVAKILDFSCQQRKEMIKAGLNNVKRFNVKSYIDKIENIYRRIAENTLSL